MVAIVAGAMLAVAAAAVVAVVVNAEAWPYQTHRQQVGEGGYTAVT